MKHLLNEWETQMETESDKKDVIQNTWLIKKAEVLLI